MAKANIESASDAWVNPPHPGDPTSDVTRDGGEPLHKPPQEGAWQDTDGVWHAKEEHADYVDTDDGSTASPYLGDSDQAQEYRDDPMPDNATERVEWAQRGATPGARINAALAAEEARPSGGRSTVLRKLRELRAEAKRNEEPGVDVTPDSTTTK